MQNSTSTHKDLFDFCLRFAKNIGKLPPATYVSDNRKYTIEYIPKITAEGEKQTELHTCARIAKDNGLVQVSENKMKGKDESFIVLVLLSVFCVYYVNKDMEDQTEADLNAVTIMDNNGYKVTKEGLNQFIEELSVAEFNKDRIKATTEYIINTQNK